MLNHSFDEEAQHFQSSTNEKPTTNLPRFGATTDSESIWPLVSLFGDQLDDFLRRHATLGAHAQQLFSDIYRDFSDRNDLFLLSDVESRLIAQHSCAETLEVATAELGLRCGVLLNESSCGSNAIALAVRYREPMISNSPQQYGPLFRNRGAVAVPILDAAHQPLACVAILNCPDNSLGEKLLLAKFIAREFGKFYKSLIPNDDPDISSRASAIPLADGRGAEPAGPGEAPLGADGFRVRRATDRRRAQRAPVNPAILAIGLTARQQQVLVLFAQGMSYKEIAREIGISSYKTVEEHLDAVREKLQVSHRRECIQKAIALGLL